MTNIIEYVKWRGDLSFDASPLNKVDNLIFCRLAYLEFDDLDKNGEYLDEIAAKYFESKEKLKMGLFLNEGTEPLLEVIKDSKRYQKVKVKNFVNVIDIEKEIQFSAVVFEFSPFEAYICFRGTDDTIVGWKEDFNMAFMDVVPAQQKALEYLKDVLKKSWYRKIYIGGHSKGGNLAVYSAINLDSHTKKRVVAVYSNDGPGFKKSFLNEDRYLEIKDRIFKLVPQSSVIGILMEHGDEYEVIKSDKYGLLQHDGFSWEVMGADFVYLDDLDNDGKITKLATKRALDKLNEEQRKKIVDIFFGILESTDSKTLTDLEANGLENLTKIVRSYADLDKDTKKLVGEMINLVLDESYKSFLEVTELNNWQNKLKNWSEETRKEIETFLRNGRKGELK